ncbi:MAG: chorismate-binding protein, partial [bacterium]|nr:chorismate-binding protein [bacterium]
MSVPPPLTVPESLPTSLRRGRPLVWVSPLNGDGTRSALLGWGEALRVEASGEGRFRDLEARFREYAATHPGAFAFVSVTFSPDSGASSVLIVPEVLGHWTAGTLTLTGPAPDPTPECTLQELDLLPGELTREGFRRAVAEALTRIEAGEVEKVVVARDLLATGSERIDLPGVLVRLAEANPGAMVFHVDGMFGASPELLVRRRGDSIRSRVLAGSAPATGEAGEDEAAAERLSASSKDAAEHAYAVRSVADRLATVATIEEAEPRILSMPTIQHLATEITGILTEPLSALALAELVHPSAAICGTPTEAAARL